MEFFFGYNIENCTNSGKIIGRTYTAGIVGYIQSKSNNLIGCINIGEIIGDGKHVGGIVGLSYGTIDNSYNKGKVTGTGERVGGIAGDLNPGSIIRNSSNEGEIIGEANNVGGIAGISFGTIENSYNKGKIEGEEYIGGITGQIGADCEAYIRNCYNEGEIIARSGNVGGIVGWTSVTGTSGTIENNYNKGTITGEYSVGGIIGRNEKTFVVTNCYNKGTLIGTEKVGSIIGEQLNGNDKLSNLYYLNTLNIGAINGEDIADKNIVGVMDDLNNYEDFLSWIEEK